MTKKQKTSKVSPIKKSKTNSTNSLQVRELDIEGHKIILKYEMVGKHSDTVELPETEIEKIPAENIINVQEVERAPFQEQEPVKGEAEEEDAFNERHAKWIKRQEHWEKGQDRRVESLRMVNLWIPVNIIHKVKMDGYPVRVFHTLRGPIIAMVLSEGTRKATVYSPAFIDPNIQKGRIHFLPMAFAGFHFTVYKGSCMGESIPQEAEIMGYPHFIKRNKDGDYRFRMKAAYHHIDADVPEGGKIVSIESTRDALEGLVATSDTKEKMLVDRARAAKAVQPTPPQ